jgi:hypothetical protein
MTQRSTYKLDSGLNERDSRGEEAKANTVMFGEGDGWKGGLRKRCTDDEDVLITGS